MNTIKPQPTPQAEWYQAVTQAQRSAGYQFSSELQSYLVITLDHFTTSQHLSQSLLAIEFLEQAQKMTTSNLRQLRNIGDQCLLLSGLFPNRAIQKNVSLDYFVKIGREAYRIIAINPDQSPLDPNLFNNLSKNFIGLMDILHHIRITQSHT